MTDQPPVRVPVEESEPAGPALELGLDAAAELLAVLTGRMQTVLPELARIVRDVRWDWLDEHGRAWAERAERVGRALSVELDAAAAVARLVAESRDAAGPPGAGSPEAGPVPVAGFRIGGPQLAGTGAGRTDDDRGVRLAELASSTDPEQPDG